MIGLAVKLCVSMGLHRRACTSNFGIKSELDKRLFWTCYMLDREVTLTMGRPPSICDHDIDTEVGNSEVNGWNCDTVSLLTLRQFPIDVDEGNMQPDDFRNALVRDPDAPVENATTLTFFLHFLKLKRIVSDIQHTVYRVDRVLDNPIGLIDGFVEQFKIWRERLPPSHPETMPRNLVIQCVRILAARPCLAGAQSNYYIEDALLHVYSFFAVSSAIRRQPRATAFEHASGSLGGCLSILQADAPTVYLHLLHTHVHLQSVLGRYVVKLPVLWHVDVTCHANIE